MSAPRSRWAYDEGRWRKTPKPVRDATQQIHGAHNAVLVAFTPNAQPGHERMEQRKDAVRRMKLACEQWLAAAEESDS